MFFLSLQFNVSLSQGVVCHTVTDICHRMRRQRAELLKARFSSSWNYSSKHTHTHIHICDFPPALVNLLHFLIILRREIAKEIGRRLCAVAYLLNINTRFRRKGCRMCMCLCVFTTPYRSSHFTPTTSILADYRAVISGHIQKGQSIGCTKRTKCSQKASQKHTF